MLSSGFLMLFSILDHPLLTGLKRLSRKKTLLTPSGYMKSISSKLWVQLKRFAHLTQ